MIDEEATYEKFGYYSADLSPKSGKKIVAVCDDCGKVRVVQKDAYHAHCYSCAKKGERHPFFGKHHSEEARKKNSDSHKGKHPSEETRKKMSDARKGIYFSEETRKKISDGKKGEENPMFGRSGKKSPSFGKHPSEETRKKLSDALKGKPLSEETKKKLSDALKGEKNHNWHGGISFEPYCVKFNEEFKEYIREKFGRVCFLCPKTEEENGQRLSVHHVNYNKGCGCDDDETCQFVPLCIGCNTKVNKDRKMWEKKIKDMMHNKLNGWYIQAGVLIILKQLNTFTKNIHVPKIHR